MCALRLCRQWAYNHVPCDNVRRVFLLGPSHNLYTPKCLLSTCTEYATPLRSIRIDGTIYDELATTGAFDEMDLAVDEREHSLEMHLPYIAHIMGERQYTLVPIMVGALSEASEARYGRVRLVAPGKHMMLVSFKLPERAAYAER